MEELRLPWSKKEGFIYGSIIAIITATLMCLFNIFRTNGISTQSLLEGIVCIPILYILVMLVMTFFVGRVADMFVRRFTTPADSFHTKIVFNIIACVTMMSIMFTLIGPTVGMILSGNISTDPIAHWPSYWPVNFCVAFWIELLLAQPIARYAMKHRHVKMMKELGTKA